MLKKIMAFLLASFLLLTLAACGGDSPAADDGNANSSSIPTVGDPPDVLCGINTYNVVPDDCTEIGYSGGKLSFKIPSKPTGKMLIDYTNEKVMPEINAISDNGSCLMKGSTSNDPLGLGVGTQPYCVFDAFGYTDADGSEAVYFIIDGEKASVERHLTDSSLLLDVRYVYEDVLYHAIITAELEEQTLSVSVVEETNQDYEIVE